MPTDLEQELYLAKIKAEEHWKFLEKWLHIVYVDAYIHGYKHGFIKMEKK